MYIAGLVIPVLAEAQEAYHAWAVKSAALFREYGCLEIVEGWEDFVPDGSQTDFRRAVNATPSEKIVFSWQIWPDKATLDAVEQAMHTDPRFIIDDTLPFDPKRLIYGCFAPLMTSGRAG